MITDDRHGNHEPFILTLGSTTLLGVGYHQAYAAGLDGTMRPVGPALLATQDLQGMLMWLGWCPAPGATWAGGRLPESLQAWDTWVDAWLTSRQIARVARARAIAGRAA